MHERPGPQYNRGSDPTTAVGKIKNATQKNDTKGFETFFSLFFVGEQRVLLSSLAYLGEGAGGPGSPISFRPKRGPKGREKIFLETGAPPLS